MNLPRLALTFAALITLAAAARAQTEYSDPANHWRLTIPPGWTQSTDDVLAQANAQAEALHSAKQFRYIAAFQRDEADANGYPYVLVQIIERPLTGASYEDVEEAFGAGEEMDQAASKLVDQNILAAVDFDQPRLDRHRNCVYIPASMALPDGTPVRTLSVAFLARHGVIQINCYDNAPTFPQSAAAFDAFVDTFRIDPGHEFVAKAPGSVWTRVIGGAAAGAAIGAVLGLLQWLKRRKPAA